MGLDLRLVPVSWNSENIQNLAVLHGFIKVSSFSFCINLLLLLRLANLPPKCMGLDLRLVRVSSNFKNIQNLVVLHGVRKTGV